MRNLIWGAIARIAVRHRMALIDRAMRTPYFHIKGEDGSLYMGRWWLFNPYPHQTDNEARRWPWRWLPSVRIHHIMRPDSDRHMHDHPWNARTIVLSGHYVEERPEHLGEQGDDYRDRRDEAGNWCATDLFDRREGYTGRLLFEQYHRIHEVSQGGVWTLFITWRKRGTWGFKVNSRKVPWREYLGINTERAACDTTKGGAS